MDGECFFICKADFPYELLMREKTREKRKIHRWKLAGSPKIPESQRNTREILNLTKDYLNMKAIVLDMYGVIVKQTGDDFVPYVQQTFPNLSAEEIYAPWFKADIGEMTSLEVWKTIGFQGDLKIQKPDERIFLLTIEKLGLNAEDCIYIDDREGNLDAAKKVGMNPVLLNSRNILYDGVSVNSFEELTKEILAI